MTHKNPSCQMIWVSYRENNFQTKCSCRNWIGPNRIIQSDAVNDWNQHYKNWQNRR